jgi:hypothetical protein
MTARDSRCRHCGRLVRWVHVRGRGICLDARQPVFHRVHDPDEGTAFWHPDLRGDEDGERTALAVHVCAGRIASR